jgi:hypothetical protein
MSWIKALHEFNKQHPDQRWTVPAKTTTNYQEVKHLMEGMNPDNRRAKALSQLRKVEHETKERNVVRAREGAVVKLRKATEGMKPGVPMPVVATTKSVKTEKQEHISDSAIAKALKYSELTAGLRASDKKPGYYAKRSFIKEIFNNKDVKINPFKLEKMFERLPDEFTLIHLQALL